MVRGTVPGNGVWAKIGADSIDRASATSEIVHLCLRLCFIFLELLHFEITSKWLETRSIAHLDQDVSLYLAPLS